MQIAVEMDKGRGKKPDSHYYTHYLPIRILTHRALFLKLLMVWGMEKEEM